MPFFRTGPVAWNGIVSFWVVFVEFFVFTALATFLCWHALKRLESEDLRDLAAR
jgi:membrane protein implicated in regulation of membrane protease activity